jgi:hypothetical protein
MLGLQESRLCAGGKVNQLTELKEINRIEFWLVVFTLSMFQLSELWRPYFIPHVDVDLPLHLLYTGRVCKALQLGLPFVCHTAL